MNSTKPNKTRVCRTPACGVEFVVEVRGQHYCTPCRHARAEATGKVCHLCGGISDVKQEGCWPCRRDELARVAEKRCQAPTASTPTKPPVEDKPHDRTSDLAMALLAALLPFLASSVGNESAPSPTVEEVEPEMVPATNQAQIDAAFARLMDGVL